MVIFSATLEIVHLKVCVAFLFKQNGFFFFLLERNSINGQRLIAYLAIIAKIVIEKIQLYILTTTISIFSPTDYLFYFLLVFKYYFMWEKV
jgi:hypothetical protein